MPFKVDFEIVLPFLCCSYCKMVSVSESPFHLGVVWLCGCHILEFIFVSQAWGDQIFIDLHGLFQSLLPGGSGVCLRL